MAKTTKSNSRAFNVFSRVIFASLLFCFAFNLTFSANSFADGNNPPSPAPTINNPNPNPPPADWNQGKDGSGNSTGINSEEGADPSQSMKSQSEDDGNRYQDKNGLAKDNSRENPKIHEEVMGSDFFPIATALLALILAATIAYIVGHRNGKKKVSSDMLSQN
mgnify:CR=1 FL=1